MEQRSNYAALLGIQSRARRKFVRMPVPLLVHLPPFALPVIIAAVCSLSMVSSPTCAPKLRNGNAEHPWQILTRLRSCRR